MESDFYNHEFEENLTRKTIIELRPEIRGFYKGLIYCRGHAQAKKVKNLLDRAMKNIFDIDIMSKIKRGCSEFSLRFPKYEKISSGSGSMMNYPSEWKQIERQFDLDNNLNSMQNKLPSLSGYCLSDFYIIQKWIDYAKGIGDPSVDFFKT